jgi:hypothetical protein
MNEDGVLLVEVPCGVADEKPDLPSWSGIRNGFIVVFFFRVERTLRG